MSGSQMLEKSVAVVGLGRIALAHLDALTSDLHQIVRVGALYGVDPDPGAPAVSAAPYAAQFASVEALLAERIPDAAIVCTPPQVRASVVVPLLRAGVRVLLEKPLAFEPNEAGALLDAAESCGTVLDVARKFTAMPAAERLAAQLTAGRLGRLEQAEIVFTGALDIRSDWRSQRALSGGGVWADNGPHAVDLAAYLLGPVVQAKILKMAHQQGTEVEDECEAELLHASGVTTRVWLSWNESQPAPIARIKGERGSVDLGWARTEWSVEAGTEVEPGGYNKREAFVRLQDRFFERNDCSGARAGQQVADHVFGAYSSPPSSPASRRAT